MPRYTVTVYELPKVHHRETRTVLKPGFTVEAPDLDEAHAYVTKRLADYGYGDVRAVSFNTDGGLTATVVAKE
jgi:hypothetical protein